MMMQFIKDIPFHQTFSKKRLKKVFHIVIHILATTIFFHPQLRHWLTKSVDEKKQGCFSRGHIRRQNMKLSDLTSLSFFHTLVDKTVPACTCSMLVDKTGCSEEAKPPSNTLTLSTKVSDGALHQTLLHKKTSTLLRRLS
jgi:hypothetical protein